MANPVGKPPLIITQEMIDKAESLAASGLTMEEIAGCLGIGERTFYEKKLEYPQFAQAIKNGKCKGIAMMANNLVKLAKGGNAAANIFFLKARAKWREADVMANDNALADKANVDIEATKSHIAKSKKSKKDE